MDMQGVDLEKLANALLILIVGVMGAFGVGQARRTKKAQPDTETMELAGAVISDRAADRLIKSMDALAASNTMLTHATNMDTDAKKALTKALEQASEALDGNTEVAGEMRSDIKEVARDMRSMTTEMIRMQGRDR